MNNIRTITELQDAITTRLSEVAKETIKGYVSLTLNDQWNAINVLTDKAVYLIHIDVEAKIGKLDPRVEMSDVVNDGFFDFVKSKIVNTLHSIVHLNSNDNIYKMETLDLSNETVGCLDIEFLCSLHSYIQNENLYPIINYLYLLASKKRYSMLITSSLDILYKTNFILLMNRVNGFLRKELELGVIEPEIILSKNSLTRDPSAHIVFDEDKKGDGSFTLKGTLRENGLVIETSYDKFNTVDTAVLYKIITTIRDCKFTQFNHDEVIQKIEDLVVNLVKKY